MGGGHMEKEGEPNAASLGTSIGKTESQLRQVLSGVPVPTAATSTRLMGQVESAENKTRELMEVAKRIDAMFGRSAKGEMQDLQKEITRLRTQLGVIGGEQVAGVDRRYLGEVQRISARLGSVEHALGIKALPEARADFAAVRADVERLSETIGVVRGMFAAGAPQEFMAAADKALELFRAGDDARARLVLRAVSVFMDNREFFTSDAGKPGTASLVAFVQALSDPGSRIDLAKAERAIEDFSNEISYPLEQRAADRNAIAGGAQALGAATAEKIATALDGLFAAGDVKRAKNLAGMALAYMNLAGRETAGFEAMKAALLRYADTGEQDAMEQFGDAATRAAFSGDIGKVRGTIGTWVAGAQKTVAEKALENTEKLLEQKKYGEAGMLLSYTAMYADSSTALGLTKAGPKAQFSTAAVDSMSTMARALNALGRGETTVEGNDAGRMFVESYNASLHSAQVMDLERSQSRLRQRFEGKTAWAKGMEPDTIPKLRAYEKTDPALKGPTLEQLFAACGRAAQGGGRDAYLRAVKAFEERLGTVYAKYGAAQMAKGVDHMGEAIHSIFQSYRGGVPADVASRLRALRDGMKGFAAELRSGDMGGIDPQLRYNALLNTLKIEQAKAAVASQLALGESYEGMARGSMAAVMLRDSNAELAGAREALVNGDVEKARKAYDAAMELRQSALATFSAIGKEKKMFGGTRAATMNTSLKMFDGWHKAHMDVFDGIFAGKETGRLQEQAGLVELSVFALPENARAIIDFSTMQKNVRESALAGDMKAAEAEWARMEKTLEKQKFWTNVATTVAGVAVGFVPGGQIVSGAIFASMATNQAIDEVAATGKVSGMTWFMLGTTLATWGVGGVISGLRTGATTARALGQAGRATAYGSAATGLTAVTLGSGAVMTGLTIPATIDAYKAGKFGEVGFNVAMMVFPLAHMGAAHLAARRGAAAGRAVQSFDDAIAEIRAARTPGIRQPEAAAAVPKPRRAPAVPQEEVNLQGAFDRYNENGLLPERLSPRMQRYIEERVRGATHEEAMDAVEGRPKPTNAEITRRIEENRRIAEQTSLAVPQKTLEEIAWERSGGMEWTVSGESISGETVTTGRMMRAIEAEITTAVRDGQDLDVIVVSGDKAKLNQINQLAGYGYGDYALDAYREVFKRAVYDAAGGDGAAFLVRPSMSGDEAIGIIVVRGGRGAEVRARLTEAVGAETKQVFNEFMKPDHPQSLAPVRDIIRNPLDAVAATVDISEPVSVRRNASGGITAANRNGSDAMVTHEVEVARGRTETVTEFMPKLVRTADEQGSASHAPAMRKSLNTGTDTEIRNAPGIHGVEAGPQVRVSGVPFEIRLEITDPAMLAEARRLLPSTRKGLYEVLTNGFGIRGFNTFLGHYGANYVVNAVEEAVGAYARQLNVRVRRIGTLKYIMEGGTRQHIEELNSYVDVQLRRAGMKLRTSRQAYVGGEPLNEVTQGDALASISNGHLKVAWGEYAYEDANAAISAMAMGNDRTLARLFGARYNGLRGVIELVRRNPAIRNVEDLFVALDHAEVGGPNGKAMKREFLVFVSEGTLEFRNSLGNVLTMPMVEAKEMTLGVAVGAEEAVLQPLPRAKKKPAPVREEPETVPFRETTVVLEQTVGMRMRGEALEAAMTLLRSEEEKAIARVLDAALKGEIEAKRVPPEYRRVIEDITKVEKEGKGKARDPTQEMILIIIKSVPDVVYNKSAGILEAELKAQGITGEAADDAMMFLRTMREMGSVEDTGRMSEAQFQQVEKLTENFMSKVRLNRKTEAWKAAHRKAEARAIAIVAKAAHTVYQQAAVGLENRLRLVTGVGKEDIAAIAEYARLLLRHEHGRVLSARETKMLQLEHLDSIQEKVAAGTPQVDAILETVLTAFRKALAARRAGGTAQQKTKAGK